MRNRLLAIVVLVLLVISACSDSEVAGPGQNGPSEPDDPREGLDIDPRRYFDEYAEGRDDDFAQTNAPTAAEGSFDTAADAVEPGLPVEPGPIEPPTVTEDNTFDDVGSTGFVAAADDPLSTFGLDVDTGSFNVGRRLLTEGFRPPPESIRIEEWVNALDHDLDAPTDTDFAVTVDHGTVLGDDETRLVRVGIAAREIAPDDRPPANITFVVDTSGSMDIRERLGLVQSSLALLVQHLDVDDTVSIVTYSDDSSVLLEPTPIAEAPAVIEAIDSLGPGGSTNLEAGLLTGYEQARAAFRPDGVNVVVLASDGVANVGLADGGALADSIREAGRDDIHLVTVGYGMGNFNDTLMEQLADRGDGFYAYVDTFEEAERLFVDELTPTLTVIAGDAKAQATFDPSAVAEYRLVGYENRAIADDDFRDDTVDAGELGAGHTVVVLYEVRLADPTATELGEISLRWESKASGEVVELAEPMVVGDDNAGDAAFELARLTATLGELLRDDPAVAERSITLEDLRTLAGEIEGADEIERLIDLALDAAPAPFED